MEKIEFSINEAITFWESKLNFWVKIDNKTGLSMILKKIPFQKLTYPSENGNGKVCFEKCNEFLRDEKIV